MKSGVFTVPRLRCLVPLLNQWNRLNSKLSSEWAVVGDAPWWYNERASISVLAGAAWKVGGYAFEEYGSPKTTDGKICAGRLDLQFAIQSQEFIAEAKQCWIPWTSNSSLDCVRDSLAAAERDVRRCAPHGMRKLAIVFGVPHITEQKREHLWPRLDRLIADAGEANAHARAWVFPKRRQVPIIKGRLYPGAIMWFREVIK